MNLALESIYRAIDESTQRMPTIVRERCPFCGGSGLREMPARHRALVRLDRCAACVGKGYVTTERVEVRP